MIRMFLRMCLLRYNVCGCVYLNVYICVCVCVRLCVLLQLVHTLHPSFQTPYNTLENEIGVEEDEEQRRPRAAQLNQMENSSRSSRYTRLQEEGTRAAGGEVDSVTRRQFYQVINFLLFTLFTVAFVVDYVVLRNVTL